MIKILFEGKPEDVKREMLAFLGHEKEPKKIEEPKKVEPKKLTPEQLTELRKVASAFLREDKDKKHHKILKDWLTAHGFERVTKITPDRIEEFKEAFGDA